jgi:hypothetical protein
MNSLQCDICRRIVSAGENGRDYFHIAEKDICEDCREKIELSIRPIVRTKQPFNFEWYDRLISDSIEKAMEETK